MIRTSPEIHAALEGLCSELANDRINAARNPDFTTNGVNLILAAKQAPVFCNAKRFSDQITAVLVERILLKVFTDDLIETVPEMFRDSLTAYFR